MHSLTYKSDTVCQCVVHSHTHAQCVARHSAADVTCILCSHKGEEEYIPAYQVDVTYEVDVTLGDRL